MNERIVGLTWDEITALQQGDKAKRRKIDLGRRGDYGADPIGDGTFRMVPRGDVVNFEVRNKRLAAHTQAE